MAGEIVEILLLLKDIRLGDFFAAGVAPQDDWAVDLSGKLGAALRVDAIGFALAALLSLRARGEANQAEQTADGQRR